MTICLEYYQDMRYLLSDGGDMKTKIGLKMLIFSILLVLAQLQLFPAVVSNSGAKLDKIYQFPMQELWRVTGGEEEEDLFGFVIGIAVTDSGNLFCRDIRNRKYYAFEKNGKFIRHFGKAGEGPSEVQNTGGAGITSYRNTVMIQDTGKILYFDDQGRFKRTVRHIGSISLFLSEDEVIVAPQNIQNLPSDQAKMKYVNLITKKERVIADFTLFKGGTINREGINASVTIPSITPVMVIGEHNGSVYYGMNSTYSIHISDLQGKKRGNFLLKSRIDKVSLKQREDVLWKVGRGLAPREVVRRLAKTMPDTETHFSSIQVVGKHIYVFKSHFIPRNYQIIDIFSKGGKHLTRAKVSIDAGHAISAGPIFHEDFIYLGIMDEEDEFQLRKYRSAYPKL